MNNPYSEVAELVKILLECGYYDGIRINTGSRRYDDIIGIEVNRGNRYYTCSVSKDILALSISPLALAQHLADIIKIGISDDPTTVSWTSGEIIRKQSGRLSTEEIGQKQAEGSQQ